MKISIQQFGKKNTHQSKKIIIPKGYTFLGTINLCSFRSFLARGTEHMLYNPQGKVLRYKKRTRGFTKVINMPIFQLGQIENSNAKSIQETRY